MSLVKKFEAEKKLFVKKEKALQSEFSERMEKLFDEASSEDVIEFMKDDSVDHDAKIIAAMQLFGPQGMIMATIDLDGLIEMIEETKNEVNEEVSKCFDDCKKCKSEETIKSKTPSAHVIVINKKDFIN